MNYSFFFLNNFFLCEVSKPEVLLVAFLFLKAKLMRTKNVMVVFTFWLCEETNSFFFLIKPELKINEKRFFFFVYGSNLIFWWIFVASDQWSSFNKENVKEKEFLSRQKLYNNKIFHEKMFQEHDKKIFYKRNIFKKQNDHLQYYFNRTAKKFTFVKTIQIEN